MLPKVTVFLCTCLCIFYSPGATVDIKYVCSSSKQITLDATQNITQLRVLKKDGHSCLVTNRTLTQCGIIAGEPVNLILQNDDNGQVIGGRNSHKVELTCSDVGVYTATIAPPQWIVKVPTTKTSLTKVIPHAITLTLKDDKGLDLLTSVEIGQALQLSFEITDQNFILSPKECTAKGQEGGEIYTMWKETDDCKHDENIISKQWTSSDQRKLSITMYGFYFPLSTHVTIECKTHVCTKNEPSKCAKTCISSSRRRREAPTPIAKNKTFSYVKSVQVSFDVAVHRGVFNGAKEILPQKQVLTLMGITVFAVMQII